MAKRRARKAKVKKLPVEKVKAVKRKNHADPYLFHEPIISISTWNGSPIIATARSIYMMQAGTWVRVRLFNQGEDIVDAS